MDEKEDLLHLLLPVFNEGLTDNDVDKIVASLRKTKHISEDGLKCYEKSSNKNEKITIFFNEVLKTAKIGWEQSIATTVHVVLDKPHVGNIAEKLLLDNENTPIKWILQNWHELSQIKEEIKSTAWIFTAQEFYGESILLQCASSMASEKADEALNQKFMLMLQEKLSDVASMGTAAAFESLEDLSHDAASLLDPIFPVLIDCLTDDDVATLTESCYKTNIISQECWNDIREQNAHQQLYALLSTMAKKAVALNLLFDFINKTGLTELYEVVKSYEAKNNNQMIWLVENWQLLKTNQHLVTELARKLFSDQITRHEESKTLLRTVYCVLNAQDEDAKSFVKALQKQLAKATRLSDEANDDEVSSAEWEVVDHFSVDSRSYESINLKSSESVDISNDEVKTSFDANKIFSEKRACVSDSFDEISEREPQEKKPNFTSGHFHKPFSPAANLFEDTFPSQISSDNGDQFERHVEKEPAEEQLNCPDEETTSVKTAPSALKTSVDELHSGSPASTNEPSQPSQEVVDSSTEIRKHVIIGEIHDAPSNLKSSVGDLHPGSLVSSNEAPQPSQEEAETSTETPEAVIIENIQNTPPEDGSVAPYVSTKSTLDENKSTLHEDGKGSHTSFTTKLYDAFFSSDKYILEFRAVISNRTWTKGDMLYLSTYCRGNRQDFAMTYSEEKNCYFQELVWNGDMSYKHRYSYFIYREGALLWEAFPFENYACNKRGNRVREITSAQWSCKHAIVFDVVVMKTMDKLDYQQQYHQNKDRFLPSSSYLQVDEEGESGELLPESLVDVYTQWIIGCTLGVINIQYKDRLRVLKIGSVETPSLRQHAKQEVGSFSNSSDYIVNLRRILNILSIAFAMKRKFVYFADSSLEGIICKGMSLHDIDRSHIEKLKVFLIKIAKRWDFSYENSVGSLRFLDTFHLILEEMLDIPERLLLLPMYMVIFSTYKNNFKENVWQKIKPTLQATNKKFDDEKSQRSFKGMAREMALLADEFPSVSHEYCSSLLPSTAAELIKTQDVTIQRIFTIDETLVIFLKFWNSPTRNTDPDSKDKKFKETVAVTFSKFLNDALGEKLEQLKELKDLRTWEKQVFEWLRHGRFLLNFLKNHASREEDFHIGCVSSALHVVDSIIIVALFLIDKKASEKLVQELELVKTEVYETLKTLTSKHCTTEAVITRDNILVWSNLVKSEWSDKALNSNWLEICKYEVQAIIERSFRGKTERLCHFYYNDLEKMKSADPIIVKLFADVILPYAQKHFNIFEKFKDLFKKEKWPSKNILKMNKKLFKAQWKKFYAVTKQEPDRDLTPDGLMEFLKFSRNTPSLLDFLCEKKYADVIGTKVKNKIKEMLSCTLMILDRMEDGSITVTQLQSVKPIKQTFLGCLDMLKKLPYEGNDRCTVISTDRMVDFRFSQYDAFCKELNSIRTLLAFARLLEKEQVAVNLKSLEEKLNVYIGNLSISELVECRREDVDKAMAEEWEHNVTFFGIDNNDKMDLYKMNKTQAAKSEVYRRLLKDVASKEDGEVRTVHDLLSRFLIPAVTQTIDVVEKLDGGHILLTEVQKKFNDFMMMEQNKTEKLNAELRLLYGIGCNFRRIVCENKHLQKRVKQMEVFFRRHEIANVAAQLNDLRKSLKLQGNFEALNLSLEADGSSEETLDSITDQGISTVKALKSLSEKQIQFLKIFAHGQNLIKWLKNHMSDVKEVTVMCDLAMISAGENEVEIDRVACFQSAVMGFSSILFGLKRTSGLEELLTACEKVFRNGQQDDTLLNKWIESSKQLAWLKFVLESYGSVETLSLTRTQDINSLGVYVIDSCNDAIPSLETTLKLHLKKVEEGKEHHIVMAYNELKDLYSRLMLIAGEAYKGKQEVNKFSDVLLSVENLAKAYVKLKLSGCLLFDKWKAEIRCGNDALTGSATIMVFFDEECPAVSSNGDVIKEVNTLTRILTDSYERWMVYLSNKRSEHYPLNYFSINQLTYLCKQLANSNVQSFPDQVYTLLSCVAENVTTTVVSKCLEEAMKITDDNHSSTELFHRTNNDCNETPMQKKKKILRKLVDEGFSVGLAKAAVQCKETLDFENLFLWCLANEVETEKIEILEKEFDEELGIGAEYGNLDVVGDVVNERTSLTLKEVIRRIQSGLEDNNEVVAVAVNTVCERYFAGTSVTSLKDCLSLEHLGKLLSGLEAANTKSTEPQRTLPKTVASGKPNLIICSEPAVWDTILSIYMESPQQPLPSAAEVLVCSDSTNEEDVEILLRRAIGKPINIGKRIFCLARAEQLSFNVAKKTEETFQQLVQMSEKNEDYRFIIITSSFHHYLTSCFDKHRIEVKFPVRDTTGYITSHLCDHSGRENARTAAEVDPDKSTVKVVSSKRAGMGKSLFILRRKQKLSQSFERKDRWNCSTIRFLEKVVNVDDVLDSLYQNVGEREISNTDPTFVHIDITPAVCHGVSKFLFDFLILGCIQSSQGVVWKHRQEHFCAIECTISADETTLPYAKMMSFFPSVTCKSPLELKELLKRESSKSLSEKELLHSDVLNSEIYQRPFQYLQRFSKGDDLDRFTYIKQQGNYLLSLETLLKYCTIQKPSWLELSNFCKFLNIQLSDCEKSSFLSLHASEVGKRWLGLKGFKQFVVRFMIIMSQDFATPSLCSDADSSSTSRSRNKKHHLFSLHQLRRRWESGFHPYLFFNDDRVSMSFVNFRINEHGALCHPVSKQVVEKNLIHKHLVEVLIHNGAKIDQNFDLLPRSEKLQTLCQVFGINKVHDPDLTYELTTDNVLKMLAIHMRFRCGIPVVVMGETGCGKTRMIEFMSKLKTGGNTSIRNMVVAKVHGGSTVAMIQEKVLEAAELANKNKSTGIEETILFFDEANTTEAIFAIKEIVCDETVRGKPFAESGLKIVAACNPYRKHSKEVIAAMEKSGLGFHVETEKLSDLFADIPMRHLVYRVISLPPSMQPLVWDFGKLNDETEKVYIGRMVDRLQLKFPDLPRHFLNVLTKALSSIQRYMREKAKTCSFVSLRDVERTLQSFCWFYEHMKVLGPLIDAEKPKENFIKNIPYFYKAFILAVGMCYHVTLDQKKIVNDLVVDERLNFRRMMAKVLSKESKTGFTDEDILNEILCCQNIFIKNVSLEKNIARNEALIENFFMIVMCSEMRVPLFLIGKPGTSKSLAKIIVADEMQGERSKSTIFLSLKHNQLLSFQCSAISDAGGIKTVFNQCASLQKHNGMTNFVATVVLDEIGLAEDSPKMPLKVLHPLLETSTTNREMELEPYRKVGFVGISNWALDPAKLNRGIFVFRGDPSTNDLMRTAEAIFESDYSKFESARLVIEALTNAYSEIYKEQKNEFFGLRDYYCLLKMLFDLISEKNDIDFYDIAEIVLRNFSGSSVDVFSAFHRHLNYIEDIFQESEKPCIPVTRLIKQNLTSKNKTRFLLLLTEQYFAVNLLHKFDDELKDYQVIFGSSFPHDDDYTELCRNINKIKVSMEVGGTVVLLNLGSLYESLYDVLNQNFIYCSQKQYVDLGLGHHRVKCRISPKFRLIIIEEKSVVYKRFPIPLVNRLEKHIFTAQSVLTDDEKTKVRSLQIWMKEFSTLGNEYGASKTFSEEDAFTSHSQCFLASALLHAGKISTENQLECAKAVLLETVTLEGVCRLPESRLKRDADAMQNIYFNQQEHEDLVSFLKTKLQVRKQISIFDITSFSQVLNKTDCQDLGDVLKLHKNRVMVLTLQQFQTEQEFAGRLNDFFNVFSGHNYENSTDDVSTMSFILLVQCPQAHLHGQLIACAKHMCINKANDFKRRNPVYCTVIIAFVFTLERNVSAKNNKISPTTFQSQSSLSVYIDELRPQEHCVAPVSKIRSCRISDVLSYAMEEGNTDDWINTKRLIKESIPIAVANLQDEYARTKKRNRVKILTELCDEKTELSSEFTALLLLHVRQAIQSCEQLANEDSNSWITKLACSSKDLLEGGSFRNALWLHIRNIFAHGLAAVVSVADVDNNLDLIVDLQENGMVSDLWLKMFASDRFCSVHWSEHSNFVVRQQLEISCTFPFFRIVFEELHHSWRVVENLTFENQETTYFKTVKDSFVQSFLDSATRNHSMIYLKRFINDMVNFSYKSLTKGNDSQTEMNTIKKSILELFSTHRKQKGGKSHENPIVEVFVLFLKILPQLQQFAYVVGVSSDILSECDSWVEDQSKSDVCVLHTAAFGTLLNKLQKEANESLSSFQTCNDWKTLVNKAKPVAETFVSILPSKFKQMWTQISFLEIFLDQLIPISNDKNVLERYFSAIALRATRLYGGISMTKDLSSLQFLKIVLSSLSGCIKEIKLRLSISWKETKCKACRQTLCDPVLLSCQCYVCQKCVPQAMNSKCPFCRRILEIDKERQCSEVSNDQKNEMQAFEYACTSFLLEYVSTFVFENASFTEQDDQRFEKQSEENLLLELQKLVLYNESTSVMSSFQKVIGSNLAARTYILRLLLHHNVHFVESHFNQFISSQPCDLNSKKILLDIYIRCIQDTLQNENNDYDTVATTDVQLANEILHACSLQLRQNITQLQHLNIAAKLQYASRIAVSCILAKQDITKTDSSPHQQERLLLLNNVAKLCKNPAFQEMQKFIIKNLCRSFGIDAFNVMLQDDLYRSLIPEYLIPVRRMGNSEIYAQSDFLVLFGKRYVSTKAILMDVREDSDLNRVFTQITHDLELSTPSLLQLMSALSTWVSYSDCDSKRKREVFNYVVLNLQRSMPEPLPQQVFENIAENTLLNQPFGNVTPYMQFRLIELVTNFQITLLFTSNSFLANFICLTLSPRDLQHSFLPAMPMHEFFLVKRVVEMEKKYNRSPKAFLCPNGHVYFIGDCTSPRGSGECPTCHEPIGAESPGVLKSRNKAGEFTEESQSGYLLDTAEGRKPTAPTRKLTKLSVCATRICLHAAMLLSFKNDISIQTIFKLPRDKEEAFVFLVQQTLKNINELSECLGGSPDDAVIVMHEIFNRIRSVPENESKQKHNWQTMEAREIWEDEFQRLYLSPIFENFENVISESQKVLNKAGRLTENPLHRLVYELLPDGEFPSGMVEWNCPNLWKYRVHISLQHLRQKLETSPASTGEGKVLKAILDVDRLDLLQHLDDILSLQFLLITRNRQKIDVADAEKTTIQDFLEKEKCQEKMDLYIHVWNEVHRSLKRSDKYGTPEEFFTSEMHYQSPISMCLPSKTGKGRCALVLAEHLIDKQNDLLHKCRQLLDPSPEFATVDVSQRHKQHFICIVEKRDLMPLVLANARYDDTPDESGTKRSIFYNIGLLEKRILEKFILRKVEFRKETIPLMHYPQDVGLRKDYESLLNNREPAQVPLPIRMLQSLDESMKNTMTSKICEVVRSLALVIQFLAKINDRPQQTIRAYAEDELMLSPTETEMIPQTAQICHCLALYERLAWHRSRRLVEAGYNPFQLVITSPEDIDNEQVLSKLKDILASMNVQRLQLELNAMVMVGPEMNPGWSLGEDALLNYLEGKYGDADNSWCERIPKEILFKHVFHVFTLSMEHLRL